MKPILLPWRAVAAVVLMTGSLQAEPLLAPVFRLVAPTGPCDVLKPGATAYEPAVKNKAYPFGTAVRNGPGASVGVILPHGETIRVEAQTQVTLRAETDDPASVVLRLDLGKVITSAVADSPEDALVVETPVGRCLALVGRGDFAVTADATAFSLDAAAAPGGSMRIAGPQFGVPLLKGGFSTRIVTTRDQSLTRVVNLVGDYIVQIDKGDEAELINVETSTKAVVRIWREHAPVGGRLIVSVLVTNSDGKGREHFAFAVGRPAIASSQRLLTEGEGAATNSVPDAAGAPAPVAAPSPMDPFL